MKKAVFKDILRRYLAGNCSEREKLLVEGWYDFLVAEEDLEIEDELQLENKIWEVVKDKTLNQDELELLKEADSTIQSREVSSLVRLSRHPIFRIAAVIIFSIGIGVIWQNSGVDTLSLNSSDDQTSEKYLTNLTENSISYWLEDSSKVTLAKNSRLEIPKAFANHTTREVYLEGEAIFDVTRNPEKPFLVHTNDITTRVLGTSFKVVSSGTDENIDIEVLSGKISVFNKEIASNKTEKNNGVILTPNQKVTYYVDKKHFVTSIVEEPILLKSSNNELINFVYEDAPIKKVISDFEQSYGIKIVVDSEGFKSCPLTADLQDLSLFSKLEIISAVLGVSYDVKGTKILMIGKGCEY